MNINIFFIFIAAILASIYIFFSPMKLHINKKTKTPQLQLYNFKVYNLTTRGVKSVFGGSKGFKYGSKYIVYDVNYTDDSTKSLANITAQHGMFKQPIIKLYGNVFYKNINGLTFKSNEATYNQSNKVLRTKGKYISYKKNDRITGYKLMYNSKNQKATSKNIVAIYQFNKR